MFFANIDEEFAGPSDIPQAPLLDGLTYLTRTLTRRAIIPLAAGGEIDLRLGVMPFFSRACGGGRIKTAVVRWVS